MKLFIDTANINHVKEIAEWGILDGVTTNPSFVAKEGAEFKPTILQMCEILPNISAQVTAETAEDMIKQADEYSSWHENVIVKVPMTVDGIKVVEYCANKGIRTNVTLVMSVNQAILAAKAGATIISPFLGRIFDAGQDALDLIRDIKQVWQNYHFETQVLAASFRTAREVGEVAKLGVDIATVKYEIIKKMPINPYTTEGYNIFKEDWAKYSAE